MPRARQEMAPFVHGRRAGDSAEETGEIKLSHAGVTATTIAIKTPAPGRCDARTRSRGGPGSRRRAARNRPDRHPHRLRFPTTKDGARGDGVGLNRAAAQVVRKTDYPVATTTGLDRPLKRIGRRMTGHDVGSAELTAIHPGILRVGNTEKSGRRNPLVGFSVSPPKFKHRQRAHGRRPTRDLESPLDIGSREFIPDEEQRASALPRQFIGETVAEVQTGGVHPPCPSVHKPVRPGEPMPWSR